MAAATVWQEFMPTHVPRGTRLTNHQELGDRTTFSRNLGSPSLIKTSERSFKFLSGEWVMYWDAYQRPLPGGASSRFGFQVHQGILAYFDNGQQVILNTWLKHGRPVGNQSSWKSSMVFAPGWCALCRTPGRTASASSRTPGIWCRPALPGRSSTTAKTL